MNVARIPRVQGLKSNVNDCVEVLKGKCGGKMSAAVSIAGQFAAI